MTNGQTSDNTQENLFIPKTPCQVKQEPEETLEWAKKCNTKYQNRLQNTRPKKKIKTEEVN
jgi:hypothetical protein